MQNQHVALADGTRYTGEDNTFTRAFPPMGTPVPYGGNGLCVYTHRLIRIYVWAYTYIRVERDDRWHWVISLMAGTLLLLSCNYAKTTYITYTAYIFECNYLVYSLLLDVCNDVCRKFQHTLHTFMQWTHSELFVYVVYIIKPYIHTYIHHVICRYIGVYV